MIDTVSLNVWNGESETKLEHTVLDLVRDQERHSSMYEVSFVRAKGNGRLILPSIISLCP